MTDESLEKKQKTSKVSVEPATAKNGGENEPETRFFTLKLLATIVLAFAAALVFRRSAGVLAMFPIAFLLCGAAAFLDIRPIAKASIFGVTVFSVNTVENDDIKTAVIFSALCFTAAFVFGYARKLIKKAAKYGIAIAAAGAAGCIVLSVVFVGNPFAAISASDKINDYTAANYPQNTNSELGEIEFSSIYYRYDTGAYAVDAVSNRYPTESASISVGGDVVRDGFRGLMEQKLGDQYVSELAAVLREAFPASEFSVEFDGFVSLPDQVLLASESGSLKANVRYEISVSGIQTADDMKSTVARMVSAIDRSGMGYAKLTFKSGIGLWTRRCITVDPNHPATRVVTELDYVSTIGTNRFSEYIREAIFRK